MPLPAATRWKTRLDSQRKDATGEGSPILGLRLRSLPVRINRGGALVLFTTSLCAMVAFYECDFMCVALSTCTAMGRP